MNTTTIFTQTVSEFGINNNKIGSLFIINKSPYQVVYEQYGYSLFKESSIHVSHAKNLNNHSVIGININQHVIQIEQKNYAAISFDIITFKRTFELFIKTL